MINTAAIINENLPSKTKVDPWKGSAHEGWRKLSTPQHKGSVGVEIYKEVLKEEGCTDIISISDEGDVHYRNRRGSIVQDEVKACGSSFAKSGAVKLWWNQIRPNQKKWSNVALVAVFPDRTMVWRLTREQFLREKERGIVVSPGHTSSEGLDQIELKRNSKTDTIKDFSKYLIYPESAPPQTNNVKGGHKNKQSYANTRITGAEQYYTNPEVVDLCLKEVKKHIDLSDRLILEPAGGTGEFIKGLQRIGVKDENIISYDTEPLHSLVKKGNYLETDMSEHKGLVSITNPPFGRASSLVKKFFNHGAGHCDYICYLVPKSWRKWTTHNSLDKNFHLVSDIELPKNCFYRPAGEQTKKDVLNTVFQIWERRDYERKEIKIPDHGLVKKIQPVQKVVRTEKVKNRKGELVDKHVKRPDYVVGANFEMVVFGHSCGRIKRITEDKVDAKTTTMYFYIEREDVKEAMSEIDFSAFYNNVSYVQALSLQEINFKLNEKFGLDNFNEF